MCKSEILALCTSHHALYVKHKIIGFCKSPFSCQRAMGLGHLKHTQGTSCPGLSVKVNVKAPYMCSLDPGQQNPCKCLKGIFAQNRILMAYPQDPCQSAVRSGCACSLQGICSLVPFKLMEEAAITCTAATKCTMCRCMEPGKQRGGHNVCPSVHGPFKHLIFGGAKSWPPTI